MFNFIENAKKYFHTHTHTTSGGRCGAAVRGRNDAKVLSELVFIALVNDPRLVDPLFLKIGAVCFSEALTVYVTTRHNSP
jgi:hypothetical protein